MKRILLITVLVTVNFVFAQTGPGGIGDATTNELWLIAENNSFINGTTQGSNNSAIQQWNDISGNTNNASQNTTAFKPTLKTNDVNGYSSLYFDGSDDRILATNLSTNSQLTLFVVFDYSFTSGANSGIIQAGPSGTEFSSVALNKTVGTWIKNSSKQPWGRGVQGNNPIRNIPTNLSINENQFYTLAQDYNGSNINQYIDGVLSGSVSYNNTLKSWTDFGIGRQASETLNGNIAEIIVYKEHLNQTKRNIIDNYLAAKYGLATVNDLYTQDNSANGDFDHHVAGIGQESATDNHLDSKGTGIIQINTSSSLTNGDYLFWGENQKDAVYDFATTTDYAERLNTTWRVSKTNDLGTVSLSVNANDLDLTSIGVCSDLQLVVSSVSTFVTKTVYNLTLSGGVYTATNVDFTDGDYFTYEYHSDIVLDNVQFYNGSGVGNAPNTLDGCYSFLVKANATGTIALTEDAIVKDIEVEFGGVLVVDGDYKLEVLEGIQLDGDIRLLGNAQLVQTHTGVSQVTGSGNLYVDAQSQLSNVYQSGYWTSPVTTSGTTFTVTDAMKDGTTQLTATSTPTNMTFTTGYDGLQTTPITISNYWLAKLTNALDWNRHQSETTSHNITEGFNMKSSGATNQNFIFVGKPNDGNYTSAITAGNSSLLGNPYPSSIDADLFLQDNVSVFSTLYFWDGTNDNSNTHVRNTYLGGYATRVVGLGTAYNGGDIPTQFIPVGQGFFVDAINSGTINFNNAQRVYSTNTSVYRNVQNFPVLRIGFEFEIAHQNIFHRQLAVGFRGLSTNYELEYDGIMYDMKPTDISLKVNDHPSDFVISGIEDYNDDLEIPLHVKLDEQRTVTFKIDALENFEPNEIYLKDQQTNQFYNLTNEVRLSLSIGDYTDRFYVVFKNGNTVSLIENSLSNIKVIDNEDFITITSLDHNIKQINIYNLLGQLLFSVNENSNTVKINNTFNKGQLLFVKTTLENGLVNVNKLLKK